MKNESSATETVRYIKGTAMIIAGFACIGLCVFFANPWLFVAGWVMIFWGASKTAPIEARAELLFETRNRLKQAKELSSYSIAQSLRQRKT